MRLDMRNVRYAAREKLTLKDEKKNITKVEKASILSRTFGNSIIMEN